MLLALYFTLLLADITVATPPSVAPNDAFPYCLNRTDRIPTFSNQKILLDTQNYNSTKLITQTGGNATWLTIDLDSSTDGHFYRWYDNDGGITCRHQFVACAYAKGLPQNNWLITQYINITDNGVDQLHINLSFTASGNCRCQQTFELWTYQTNVINETNRGDNNSYTFANVRLVHTNSEGLVSQDSQSFSVSSNGLYLAIVDDGSCIVMTRLVLYYSICPNQVINLVQYPETVAPSTIGQDKVTNGSCVSNASPVSDIKLYCRNSGVWSVSSVSCSCNAGYQLINNTVCEACEIGTYKSIQSNEQCTECPENSDSSVTEATSCTCVKGYYRASSEGVNYPCTALPSTPQDLHSTSISVTSITIVWTAPNDTGGRNDVFYTVRITDGATYTTNNTYYTLTGLNFFTTYTIQVTARNGVSDQDPTNDDTRTINITVTTASSPPTQPENIQLNASVDTSVLTWSKPQNLYGTLISYIILINTDDDPSTAFVLANVSPLNTSFDLSNINYPSGTYYIWVIAVNEFGQSNISSLVTYIHRDVIPSSNISTSIPISTSFSTSIPANSNNTTLIVFVSVLSFICFLITVTLLICSVYCILTKVKKQSLASSDEDINETPTDINVAYNTRPNVSQPPTNTAEYYYIDEIDVPQSDNAVMSVNLSWQNLQRDEYLEVLGPEEYEPIQM